MKRNIVLACFLWFFCVLAVLVPGQSFAHGHYGSSLEQPEVVFQRLVESMLTLRKVSHLPEAEKVYVRFGQEQIPVSEAALYHLVKASAELYLSTVSVHCEHCSHGHQDHVHREVKKLLTAERFDKLYQSVLKTLQRAEIKLIQVAGWTSEKVIHYGMAYVIYTGITEAIESTVMGPMHWACTFFQMMYWPVAIYTNATWSMLSAQDTGISFLKRLHLSHLAYVYDFKFRLVLSKVVFQEEQELRKLRWKELAKDLHEADQSRLESVKELGLRAEFLRDFLDKRASGSGTPWWIRYTRVSEVFSDSVLKVELRAVVDPGQGSPQRRFFRASKHVQTLELARKLFGESLTQAFEHGDLSRWDYLKTRTMLGTLGAKIDSYKAHVYLYALSPADNLDREILEWHGRRLEQELQNILSALAEGVELMKVIQLNHSQGSAELSDRMQSAKASVKNVMVGASFGSKCLKIISSLGSLRVDATR